MPKNTTNISCIFCGAVNTIYDTECSDCSKFLKAYDTLVGTNVNGYILSEYKSRGFYGLTYKASDSFGKEYAIKLISKNVYKKYDKDFDREAKLYATLVNIQTIVNYVGAGSIDIILQGENVSFHFILCEWIQGITLKEYLNTAVLGTEELIIIAKDLLAGIQELYERQLWHNDLHDENILVTTISTTQMRLYSRTKPLMFKIIDVGSMVYKNKGDARVFSDMINIGNHLVGILSKLKITFSSHSKEDQYFISLIDDVCNQLVDEHPGRSFASPLEALDKIEEMYSLSRKKQKVDIKKLESPYGYINANDITSSWLLVHMFSDKLTYFKEILSLNNQSLLITGPRGCGKTMLLKNMRFLTMLNTDGIDSLQRALSIGIFISARTNFGNYLVSYREYKWVKDESRVLMYFNILVTMEIIDIIHELLVYGVAESIGVEEIIKFLSSSFDLHHVSIFTVKSKLVAISRKIISDEDVYCVPLNSTPAYLNDLVSVFLSVNAQLSSKEVVILVDDLTLPRVPIDIQRALVPAIFNTGARYKTRVTAHSDGIVLQDLANEFYQANRDFREINHGLEYWELSDNYSVCRDCFDDILLKRFQLADRGVFPGIESFLGGAEKLENIGREINRLSKENNVRNLRYHGSRVFVKLCSGDLSYLLDILGKMEVRGQGKQLPIPSGVQSGVIRTYARNELRLLQDIKASNDVSLYDIAHQFGVWSKSKLVTKDADYIKIELEVQDLPDKLRTAVRELLCYGIFVDGGLSNSAGMQVTRKLLFRRIFTPAFPTTFNSSNTFPMTQYAFQRFIERPYDFVKEKMTEDRIPQQQQMAIEQLEFEY